MAGSKWVEKHGKLFKRFEFNNFAEALEFVNKIGELAEQKNHHPDISFGWGYVEVSLFTHSENKITKEDQNLASSIDQILK